MAKQWTVPRTPEDLQRRYRLGDTNVIQKELREIANSLIFDAALDVTSTNAIQNAPVATAIGNKVDKVAGKQLSSNDYTNADKSKLEDMPTITQADVDRWNSTSGDGWIPPIGYIWISASNTDPGTLFTGTTWESIGGKFLLGADSTYTAGSTGGEVSHVLTIDEMPSHTHTTGILNNEALGGSSGNATAKVLWNQAGGTATTATGGGQAHNNMPPYLSVYMWKRVS